jgi:hypothetical protein
MKQLNKILITLILLYNSKSMRLIALDVNTFSLLAASYVALWANRSDCENIVLVTVEPTPSISANPACWRFTNYEKNKGYRIVIKLELKGVVDGIDGNDFLGFS